MKRMRTRREGGGQSNGDGESEGIQESQPPEQGGGNYRTSQTTASTRHFGTVSGQRDKENCVFDELFPSICSISVSKQTSPS